MSIVRMAKRLSGRWPDCQGFRDVRIFDEPQDTTDAGLRLKQAETPGPVSSRSTLPAKMNPKHPQIGASRRKV